jgi:hypothetical protein
MLYSNAVIDWMSLLFNTFWIVGTAVLLASFSYQYAQTEPPTLKERLSQPSFLRWLWVGFVFITIGLAGTSQSTWEIVLWIVFILWGVSQILQSLR